MTLQQYRKRWLRLHKKYEKRSYKLLMKMFKEMASKVPYEFLTEEIYEATIDAYINERDIYKVYLEMYETIGLSQGKVIGKTINKQAKDFSLDVFVSEFNRQIFEFISQKVAYRITSVRDEFSKYIKNIVSKGFTEGKTVNEIAKEIRELIGKRNFYRWQALRIARTETSAAANYGATISAESSRIKLEKVWISADDSRVRKKPKSKFDHVVMNGVAVEANEPFNVQGELLPFPASPITANNTPSSAGNTINCRCTVGYRPKRDKDGNIIRI